MSKFEISNRAGKGRPKGSPNKVTATAKEFLQMLSDELRETILNDLSQLEPLERVKVFIQLQEFLIPKLARKQIEPIGEDNKIEYIINVVEGKERLPYNPD
jgi:hypothetical protein